MLAQINIETKRMTTVLLLFFLFSLYKSKTSNICAIAFTVVGEYFAIVCGYEPTRLGTARIRRPI